MRVSVVAGLIVAVHAAVIGSVVMTQGCASTKQGAGRTQPEMVEPAPPPVLPPSETIVEPVEVEPVVFPPIQPPVKPEAVSTDVAAENVYVVRKGDMLSKIASRHGVSTRELAELNGLTDPNKIRAGQKLILPDYAKPSQSQPGSAPAAAPAKPQATAAAGGTYVVKAGDSLSKIAKAHGVKVKDLAAANNIADPNKIRVGQKLTIPDGSAAPAAPAAAPAKEEPVPAEAVSMEMAPAPAAPAPEAAPEAAPTGMAEEEMLDYTVQEGDTLESIARLFVVRQDDIRRQNNIPAGQDVQPQQVIKIPPTSAL